MAILFVSHEFSQRITNKAELKKWLQAVAKSEKKSIGDLTYIFTGDDYLHDLNKKYLHHNTLTDIITFDYSEDGILNGDIFISIERVKENALKFKATFKEELYRVMVHGLLHLAGYTDKTKATQAKMRKKENEALVAFKRKL